MKYFATCGRGVEPILVKELESLNASDIQPGRGGVSFAGDQRLLYSANLWLRSAVRVLQPILEFPVESTDELYDAVRELDWSELMTISHTLAVDANVRDSKITHSKYAALRVKDAICDQFIDKIGKRPSVDVENPLIGLNLHIARNQAVLSLDSSGQSLHKRGYRGKLHRAALNEALAAVLVLHTDWDGDVPLIDPMCGSGTIVIEAAWIALNRPPGLTRKRFGFQGWLNFDRALWNEIRDQARQNIKRELPSLIQGCDVRRDVLELSEENSRAAGMGHLLSFTLKEFHTFEPPEGQPGIILCNPPYGERIGEEEQLRPLYRRIGTLIASNPEWSFFIFTGNAQLAKEIGHEPREKFSLYNGRIPCQLLCYGPDR